MACDSEVAGCLAKDGSIRSFACAMSRLYCNAIHFSYEVVGCQQSISRGNRAQKVSFFASLRMMRLSKELPQAQGMVVDCNGLTLVSSASATMLIALPRKEHLRLGDTVAPVVATGTVSRYSEMNSSFVEVACFPSLFCLTLLQSVTLLCLVAALRYHRSFIPRPVLDLRRMLDPPQAHALR